jgi:hypothetical protein
MRNKNIFVIESELSRHRLSLNGQEIRTFATLDAAEEGATRIANLVAPGIKLQFGLDFKWTLSDLEIRAATMDVASNSGSEHSDHSGVERGSACGS